MGLLTTLVFLPVTGPVAGIKWTLGKVQRVVEDELVDDTPVKEDAHGAADAPRARRHRRRRVHRAKRRS